MQGVLRHGDGNDAALRGEPRQSDLVRRGAMSVGYGFKRVADLQAALVNGRISGEQDIIRLAASQDAVLGIGSVTDAIGHLVGKNWRARQFTGLLQQREVEVADAEMAHFAISDQLVQGPKCVWQAGASAGPMDEVQVQILCGESAETGFTSPEHIGIAQVPGLYFGCDEKRLAGAPLSLIARPISSSAWPPA